MSTNGFVQTSEEKVTAGLYTAYKSLMGSIWKRIKATDRNSRKRNCSQILRYILFFLNDGS